MIARSQPPALDALLTIQNAADCKNGNTVRLLTHTDPAATATLSPEKIIARATHSAPATIPAISATSPATPIASYYARIQALTAADAIVPATSPAKTATIPAIAPAMIQGRISGHTPATHAATFRPLLRPHHIRPNTVHPYLFPNSSRFATNSDHSGKNSGNKIGKTGTHLLLTLTARLARVKNEKIRNFQRKHSTFHPDNPTGHLSGHVPATHRPPLRPHIGHVPATLLAAHLLSRARQRTDHASEEEGAGCIAQ